jgi:hypothetical protein
VRALDGSNAAATQTYTLTVLNTNDPPSITSSPDTTALAGDPYSYPVEAEDVDAHDSLSYSLVASPAGMSIDSLSGSISWTPGNNQTGDTTVIVQVEDDSGAAARQTFAIFVTAQHTTRAVKGTRHDMPNDFSLSLNYPNPFRISTRLKYLVPPAKRIGSRQDSRKPPHYVTIAVYDPAGHKVRTLVDRAVRVGIHEVVFDGTDDSGRRLGRGIFFCKMIAGDFESTVRMTLF